MSDKNAKATPSETKPRTAEELSDEALDNVSGGMKPNLGVVVPKFTGGTGLVSDETDGCITN